MVLECIQDVPDYMVIVRSRLRKVLRRSLNLIIRQLSLSLSSITYS